MQKKALSKKSILVENKKQNLFQQIFWLNFFWLNKKIKNYMNFFWSKQNVFWSKKFLRNHNFLNEFQQ
jgi:hypothetical protein